MNNRHKKPDLPVTTAFLGGIFRSAAKNLNDYKRENSYVLSKQDEIDRFVEAFGNDWVEDVYY